MATYLNAEQLQARSRLLGAVRSAGRFFNEIPREKRKEMPWGRVEHQRAINVLTVKIGGWLENTPTACDFETAKLFLGLTKPEQEKLAQLLAETRIEQASALVERPIEEIEAAFQAENLTVPAALVKFHEFYHRPPLPRAENWAPGIVPLPEFFKKKKNG